MFTEKEPLTYKKIFIFWAPLAATWLMMATEGPFLAAVIARLANPKYNLAAYGVAFSFAVLIEAPIIMIMSASTALVKDKDSFFRLRNFTYVLNGILTAIMVIFILPPVFTFITQGIIGLPENVARLTHHACVVMLPWPGAIGYRRFYQGILIRSNLTRRVAYGTMVRLSTMTVVSLGCYLFSKFNGALVGALALSCSVSAEAIAIKLMARKSVKDLKQTSSPPSNSSGLTYRSITTFYYPLALTSVLALGVYPLVTFFMGQSRMPIESLAVLPVVNSLVFIFRSLGLSFQEVGIALLGEQNENFRILRNFAAVLGVSVVVALSLIAFTPVSILWFQKISGLSISLTQFSLTPARILVMIPGLTVLISLQRSLLVNNKRTPSITIATAIEVASIFCLLYFTIHTLGMIGAVSAALALVSGRTLANIYLLFPCYKTLALKK
jgi:hypothetical protein